mmetsp:Transcript_51881/g.151038  ORF Transcript_51881/g.151038 Transcript_51881/m.151038 type:complete len:369 (+) Transcript_51881:2356-3462(+)
MTSFAAARSFDAVSHPSRAALEQSMARASAARASARQVSSSEARRSASALRASAATRCSSIAAREERSSASTRPAFAKPSSAASHFLRTASNSKRSPELASSAASSICARNRARSTAWASAAASSCRRPSAEALAAVAAASAAPNSIAAKRSSSCTCDARQPSSRRRASSSWPESSWTSLVNFCTSSFNSATRHSPATARSAATRRSSANLLSDMEAARCKDWISSRNEATTMFSKLPHKSESSSLPVTSTTSLLTLASTSTFIARDANSKVECVSAAFSGAGLMHTNSDVLQFPPTEPSRIRVSLLSRNGTCIRLAANALTTLPNTCKLRLMANASFSWVPSTQLFLIRSDPAKSTMLNRAQVRSTC